MPGLPPADAVEVCHAMMHLAAEALELLEQRAQVAGVTPARTVFAVRSAALFLPFQSLNPRQPHFGRSSP